MQSTNLVDVNSLIDEQPSKTVDVNSLIEQPQKKNSLQPSPASSAPSVQSTLPSVPQSKSVESNPPVKPLLNTQQAAEKFGLTPIQNLQNQNIAKSDNTLSVPNAGVFNKQVNAFNEVTDKTITGNAPDESVVIRNEYQKKRKGILNPEVVIPASQLTPENNFGLNANLNTPQVADNAVNKIQVKPVQGAPVNAVAPPTPEQEFKQKVYDNLSSLEKETIAKSGEYAMKVTSDPVAAGFITKAILGDNMAISQKRQIDKGYTVPQADLYQTGQVGITSMIAALDKKYESDPQNADYIAQKTDLENQAKNLIDKFPEYKVSQLTKAVAIELGKLHPEVSNSPSMARLYLPEIKKEMGLSDEDVKAIDFDNYPTSNFLTSTIAPIYKGALGLGLSATRAIGSALGADEDLLNSRLTEAAQSPTFFDDIETIQNTGQTIDTQKGSRTFLQNIADPNKGKYNYTFHNILNSVGSGAGSLAWFVYGTKGAGAAANKALGAVGGLLEPETSGIVTAFQDVNKANKIINSGKALTKEQAASFQSSKELLGESLTNSAIAGDFNALNSVNKVVNNADGAIMINNLPFKLSADATNEVGMAGLMMGQGYEDYYQKARTVISDKPEDEWKRHTFSLINGALDYLGFRVLGNVVKGLPPAAEKEIGQVFKDAPNLASVNKKALQSKLTDILKGAGEAAKETAFVGSATTASEIAKAVVVNVMGNDEAAKEENAQLPSVIEGSIASLPFSMFIPILGSKIIAGGQSKVHKENIYNAGISPENYKGDAHKLFDMGAINQEQLNDRIQVINTADKVVKSIPSDVFENLNHNQRVTYVNSKIRELALKAKSDGIQDEALSAYYADQIKGEVAKRSDVLNGGGKEGEFPESVSVIKPKTQEEINNQIPTVTIAPKENTPETKKGVSVVLPQTIERGREMPTVTVGGKTNENATEKTAEVPKLTEVASTTNEAANKVEQPTEESLIQEYRDKTGVTKEAISDENLLEEVAMQAQNLGKNPETGKYEEQSITNPRAYENTSAQAGKELTDLAVSKFPKNKLLKNEKETKSKETESIQKEKTVEASVNDGNGNAPTNPDNAASNAITPTEVNKPISENGVNLPGIVMKQPSVLINDKGADGWLRGALQNFEGGTRLKKLDELEAVVNKNTRLSDSDRQLSLEAINRERKNLQDNESDNAQTPTEVNKPISVNEGEQKRLSKPFVDINKKTIKDIKGIESDFLTKTKQEVEKSYKDVDSNFRASSVRAHEFWVEQGVENGYYKNAIEDGKITVDNAKKIIESAGLEVPKDILGKANSENIAPKEKPISKPISEVKEKPSKPTNTKESNFSKKLKDKYKDFNLGGTKSAEKSDTKIEGEIKTDNGKQPIEQYVSRAKEVLNKLFPDATFETYKTADEYVKAGGAEGSRGMFDSKADGTKRLLLNLEQMKEDGIGKTAFHEAIHPIVDEVVGAHPEELNPLWNDLYKEMQGVKGFEKVVEHVKLYKQNERPAAEGLTELLTQIAEGNISLEDVPPARKGIIVDLLNKLFEKLGLNIRFGESYDFKDFATDIKKAFETGDVEALKNVVDERAEANKRAKDNAGKVNDLLFGKSADKGKVFDKSKDVYDNNEELPKIGTHEEYSKYLKSIFPDSKINDIVYHGSKSKFDQFNDDLLGSYTKAPSAMLGHFFASNIENTKAYSHERPASFHKEDIRVDEGTRQQAVETVRFLESEVERLSKLQRALPSKEIRSEYEKVIKEQVSLIERIRDFIKKIFFKKYETKQEYISRVKDEFWKQKDEYEQAYKDYVGINKRLEDVLYPLLEGKKLVHDYIPTKDSNTYTAILDVTKLDTYDDGYNAVDFGKFKRGTSYATRIKASFDEGKDGVIIKNTQDPLDTDIYIVKKASQIHILGSKSDVDGFKTWKETSKGRFESAASKIADSIRNADIPQWIINTSSEAKQSGFGLSGENMKEALAKSIEAVGKIMDKGVDLKEAIAREVDNFIKNIKSFDGIKDLKSTFEKTLRDNFEKEALNQFNKEQSDRTATVENMVKDAMDEGFDNLNDIKEAITNGLGIDTPAFRKMIDDAYERVNKGGVPPKEPINSSENSLSDDPPFTLIKSNLEIERERLGMNKYEGSVVSNKRAMEAAIETMNKWKEDGVYNKEIKKVLDDALTGEISDAGQNILAQHIVDLQKTMDNTDRYSKDYDDLLLQKQKAIEAGDVLRSEAGRILGRNMPMRGKIIEKVSDVEMDMMDDSVSDSLTKEQKQQAQERFDAIKKKLDAEQELRQKAEEEIARLKAERKVKKEAAISGKKTREDYIKERTNIRKSIKEKWIAAGKTDENAPTQAGFVNLPFSTRQLMAVAPDVSRLMKSYLHEGTAKTLEEVQKLLKKDLDEEGIVLENGDIRRLIAGDFDTPKKGRNEILEQVSNLKREQRIMNEIENLENGKIEVSPKREKRNNKRLAELRKRLEAVRKLKGVGKYSVESKNEAAEKAAEKNINELEEKIKNNDLAIKKSESLNETERVKELRQKQKQLKNDLENKRKAAMVGKYSDQARNEAAQKAAKKSIEDLENRIKNNELGIKKSEELKQTERTKELRQKQKDLNEQLDKKRKEAKVGKYSDEQKFTTTLKQRISANEKEQQRLLEKIKNKDYAEEVESPFIVDNKELQAKNKELYDKYVNSLVEKEKALVDYEKARIADKLKNRDFLQKAGHYLDVAVTTSKGTVAMFDQSVFLVQMLPFTFSHPVEALKYARHGLQMFKNKTQFERNIAILHNSKWWNTIEKSGLAVYEPTSAKRELRNELHGGEKNLLNKDIIIGNKNYSAGQAFERSTSTLLNDARIWLFMNRVSRLQNAGKTIENSPREYEAAARVVNELTGHGKPHQVFQHELINHFIWSTKMFSSTLNLLGLGDLIRPVSTVRGIAKNLGIKVREVENESKGFYTSLTPTQGKFVATEVARFVGFGVMMMYLSKILMPDVEVDYDPRSSGFGTIKIGHKTYPIFGRFGSAARTIVQSVILGEKKYKGKTTVLGEKYGSPTAWDVFFKSFVRGKATPLAGTMFDYVLNNKKNYYTKEELDAMKITQGLVVPLSLGDIPHNFIRDGFIKGVSNSLLGVYGLNAWDDRDFVRKPKKKKTSSPKYTY